MLKSFLQINVNGGALNDSSIIWNALRTFVLVLNVASSDPKSIASVGVLQGWDVFNGPKRDKVMMGKSIAIVRSLRLEMGLLTEVARMNVYNDTDNDQGISFRRQTQRNVMDVARAKARLIVVVARARARLLVMLTPFKL